MIAVRRGSTSRARIAPCLSAFLTLEPFAPSHYATLSSWFATEREVVQWGGPAVHHPLDVEQLQRMLPDAGTPPSHLAWMALADHARVGHRR